MESLNGTEGSRALIQSVLHLTLWQAQVNASYRESQRAIADSDDGPAADVVHCDGIIASIDGIVILNHMPYRDQRFGDSTQIILTFQT